MPRENEAAWQRAKRVTHKQYPNLDEDDDKFWAIVQHIYQYMKSFVDSSVIHKDVMSKAIEVTLMYPELITKSDIIDNYYLILSHLDDLSKAAHKLQGRLKFQDLDISIENKAGSVRKWYDPLEKKSGQTKMKNPYGYIRLTEGVDGEHVDCYLGKNKKSKKVYVVHQQDPNTEKYDEDKVMLGFNDANEAKDAYLEHYDNPKFFGSMDELPINDFKDKVKKKKGKISGKRLSKAKPIHVKKEYSGKEVKALGMRWITIRGNHVLVQQLKEGGWVVVGGAGGKLSHFKVEKLMSPQEYKQKQKERMKERLEELTSEQIKEHAKVRKEEIVVKRKIRTNYEQAVKDIVGAKGEDFKAKITMEEMDVINETAKENVTRVTKDKELPGALEEEAVEQEAEKLKIKAEKQKIKQMEKQAVNVLAADYFGEQLDPNQKKEIEKMIDVDTAKKVLLARKHFKQEIKRINKGKPERQPPLKIGETFGEESTSITDDIVKEVQQNLETQRNVKLYEKLNAQSKAIQKHIDVGALESLNGIVGDVYGTGAVFSARVIESIGLEACSRIVAAKFIHEGKKDIISNALQKWTAKNNMRLVDSALKDSGKRFATADKIRKMAIDSDDEAGLLNKASANGYALRQIIHGQRTLGTAVGSLRATAHIINALEEQPGESVLIDMGKNLFRARGKAKEIGLKRGDYSMRTNKEGRLIMDIPSETYDKFFSINQKLVEKETYVDRIKKHEANTGYIPPGVKEGVKLFPAQEAGLRFFKEKEKVILDFEAGIGKTAIGYAAAMEAIHNKGAKKVLIVTPAKLRNQFYQERKTFLDTENQKNVTLNHENTKPADRRKHYEREGINIIGHDQLRLDAQALKDANFDMIVVDEIHEMTNPSESRKGDSGRFGGMIGLSDIPMKIGMSGTNIKNSKKEFYKKIKFIDPNHNLGTMKEFEDRYKGLNQGTGSFQQSANDSFRRDVAPWTYTQKMALSKKNSIEEVRVKLTPAQRKAYRKSEQMYTNDRQSGRMGAAARRDSRNYDIIHDGDPLNNGKLNYIIDTMETKHKGEKAVIHVYRRKAVSAMKKALESKYGKGTVGVIHGESSKVEINKLKADFNNPDSKIKFLVGTKSLENGHNLQMGGTVTFHLDVPNTYAAFDQRNKRIYRRGQDRDVTSYLVSSDTPYDFSKEDILQTKKKEMAILGNPRAIEEYDEDGFLAMLNQVEKEK